MWDRSVYVVKSKKCEAERSWNKFLSLISNCFSFQLSSIKFWPLFFQSLRLFLLSLCHPAIGGFLHIISVCANKWSAHNGIEDIIHPVESSSVWSLIFWGGGLSCNEKKEMKRLVESKETSHISSSCPGRCSACWDNRPPDETFTVPEECRRFIFYMCRVQFKIRCVVKTLAVWGEHRTCLCWSVYSGRFNRLINVFQPETWTSVWTRLHY